MKQVDIKDTTQYCGIYLIQYPNGKIYIGQSQNIHKRILEHNSRARLERRGDGKDIALCDKAINKYFLNGIQNYYILELCNVKELDDKEKYYIELYHACDKEKGYNIVDKGNVSGRRGIEHVNAALNENQLKEVLDLLINHCELSYVDIAKKYNVSAALILRINSGICYTQDDISYPIRKNNHQAALKNKVIDYFSSEEELLKLKHDLKYSWWLTVEKDLTEKYNIPLKIMHEINTGKKFQEIGNYSYPIRDRNIRNFNNLTQEDVINILTLLKDTSLSMEKIGLKYNLNRRTVAKINQGLSYIIENYNYPARLIK